MIHLKLDLFKFDRQHVALFIQQYYNPIPHQIFFKQRLQQLLILPILHLLEFSLVLEQILLPIQQEIRDFLPMYIHLSYITVLEVLFQAQQIHHIYGQGHKLFQQEFFLILVFQLLISVFNNLLLFLDYLVQPI